MKQDFGPFELHEKIGGGGMASVYRGMQKALQRTVVLKVLYPHLAEDEKFVARFEREARNAANLEHENIVGVIDYGKHEGLHFIAMEFVDGFDLKRWMEKYGPPPLEMALLILRDICRGLEHAHQRTVVHRDIKPANVMLTPDGTVKIMDFGLARRGEETTTVTVDGSVLGTPAYMSPEQAEGKKVDKSSDIFSAGVVAYELLGGQRPFAGDSYSSVLNAILKVDPPRLEIVNPLIPDEVVTIVHHMLEKNKLQRCPSIGVARRDLDTVIERMGLHRAKDLLNEYTQNPIQVGDALQKERLAKHLDQGLRLETLGPAKVGEALREFERVLHMDPRHKVAQEHLKRLQQEQEQERARQRLLAPTPPEVDQYATQIMPPPEEVHKVKERKEGKEGKERKGRKERRLPVSTTRLRNLLVAASGVLVLLVVVGGIQLFREKGDSAGGREEKKTAEAKTAEAKVPVHEAPRDTTPKDTTPKATPAPVAAASVAVNSRPTGAQVFLDGVAKSEPTNLVMGGLSPGEHVIRVEKPGFLPQEKRVTLGSGKRDSLSFTLQTAPPATGKLEIKVRPYASFYVDGKLEKANVALARITVKAGKHSVKAVHPAFPPKEWKGVQVGPNATVPLSYDFPGNIRVTSGGTWAYVHLDGKNMNKPTPCVLEGVRPGKHTVTVVREPFTVEGGPKTVTVGPGETVPLEFKLQSK